MSPPATHIYRRFLPHWRIDGAVYVVTWRLHQDQVRLSVLERQQVAEMLHRFDGDRYELFAYVVMDDHVHALLQPHVEFPLEGIVHSWKSYSAWLFQRGHRQGRVWQREYYDRIVRSRTDFDEKLRYILDNPYRRWPGIEEYPWAWSRHDAAG